MKAQSAALAAHRGQRTTTLAYCWKATRKSGEVLAVTSCARDLLFDGVLYLSKDGFNPKAISQEASAAVVNTEVDGFLSDEITEADFEVGKWDGCKVDMFEVNYRDLSMGSMRLASFTMGDIEVTRSAFNAKMRGLTQALQMVVGRLVTAGCPWRFGDMSTCRKDLGPLTVTGAVTSVADLRTFADASRSEVSDYFGGGVLTFTSGANVGEALEIYSYASGSFVMHLPFLHSIAVGDTYSLTPGCRKRFQEDCKGKWNNVPNFGGFPYLPGNDKVIGLGGTEGTIL